MAGVFSRISTIFQAKTNKALNKIEASDQKPKEKCVAVWATITGAVMS